jgi:hypothetical protein
MSLYGLSANVGMGNQMLSDVGNENEMISQQNTKHMEDYTLANKNEKELRQQHDYILGGSDAVGVISGLRSMNQFTKKARAYDSGGSALTGWANMAKDNISGGADPKEWMKNNTNVPMAEGNVASDTFQDRSSIARKAIGVDTETWNEASGPEQELLAKHFGGGSVSSKVSSGTTSTLDDIVGPEPEPEALRVSGVIGVDDISGKNPVMPTEKLGTSEATFDGGKLGDLPVDSVASDVGKTASGGDASMTGRVLKNVIGDTSSATADLIGKSVGNAGAIIDGVEGIDTLIRSKGKNFFDPNESGLSRAGDITQMAGAGLDFLATALPFLAPVAIAANIAGGIMDSVGKVDDDAKTAEGLAAPGAKKQAPLASSQGWADMGMVASAQSDPVRQIQTSSAF